MVTKNVEYFCSLCALNEYLELLTSLALATDLLQSLNVFAFKHFSLVKTKISHNILVVYVSKRVLTSLVIKSDIFSYCFSAFLHRDALCWTSVQPLKTRVNEIAEGLLFEVGLFRLNDKLFLSKNSVLRHLFLLNLYNFRNRRLDPG